MSEEISFVPLNDAPKLKKSSSRGSDIDVHHKGEVDTHDYRLHAACPASGKQVSLWHDISLRHTDPETHDETPYMNFVCEIPKFTRYA
jgi:inorganic pyrophosphatase